MASTLKTIAEKISDDSLSQVLDSIQGSLTSIPGATKDLLNLAFSDLQQSFSDLSNKLSEQAQKQITKLEKQIATLEKELKKLTEDNDGLKVKNQQIQSLYDSALIKLQKMQEPSSVAESVTSGIQNALGSIDLASMLSQALAKQEITLQQAPPHVQEKADKLDKLVAKISINLATLQEQENSINEKIGTINTLLQLFQNSDLSAYSTKFEDITSSEQHNTNAVIAFLTLSGEVDEVLAKIQQVLDVQIPGLNSSIKSGLDLIEQITFVIDLADEALKAQHSQLSDEYSQFRNTCEDLHQSLKTEFEKLDQLLKKYKKIISEKFLNTK